VHGAAADAAAAEGERGLLALDVIDALRRPLNPCR
jgi:NAD(P)H-hydrate repair Nnr-like enzyme with NAD(P)H-hydrate dehydratase domain